MVASRASEKGLELVNQIESQVPHSVISDVTRLRQILVNLLGNAIKFTETGEVLVSVNARCIEAKASSSDGEENGRAADKAVYELHFSVSDTGIGIPKERVGQLFQSFSQVDASTTRKYGGTGLGLAISKQLSEMMGGRMWVESELGQGSTFHFTIQAEAASPHTQLYTYREQLEVMVGKRMLIVDDNKTNRLILESQLQSWAIKSQSAASGKEALAALEGQALPFDLGILDMHMPEMDGLDLAKNIRKVYNKQTLPLIMLNSLGNFSAELDHYFNAVLTKPVKAAQLFDTIVMIIGDKQNTIRPPDMSKVIDNKLGERNPLRILLAEDNSVNQKVALAILKKMGYRADVAANGLEVLDALKRQAYDVILMDVQMPEMDGVEATQQIRQRWSAEEQPRIIALTANALQGDREQYLQIGMDDYLSKPMKAPDLAEVLNKCRTRQIQINDSSQP